MTGNASVFWLSCFELREPWHPLVYNRWNRVRWAMNWSRLHSDQARNDFHRIRDVFNMIPPFENRETNLDHKRIVWSWFIFTGSEFLFLSLICIFLFLYFYTFLILPCRSQSERAGDYVAILPCTVPIRSQLGIICPVGFTLSVFRQWTLSASEWRCITVRSQCVYPSETG